MFYSSYLFVKKGPLAGLWLAAHWQRKLTKVMITQTNLLKAKHAIEQPETPLALRVSGQLLLGLVRIYDRKVRYLQEDCSEAITTLKQAYRAGKGGTTDSVNLPADAQQAAHGVISLPDHGDEDMNVVLPDIDIDELLADHSAAQLDDDVYGIVPKKKRSRTKKSSNQAVEDDTDTDSVIMSQTQKARAADITLERVNLSQSSRLHIDEDELMGGIAPLEMDFDLPMDEMKESPEPIVEDVEQARDDQQRSRIEEDMMEPLVIQEEEPVGKADQSAVDLANVSIMNESRHSMIPASPEPDDMESKYDPKKRSHDEMTGEEEMDAIPLDEVDDTILTKTTKTKHIKKARIERVDTSTEISGKDMASWIADCSNLVTQRATVPCTRAARMLQDITNLPHHLSNSITYPHLPAQLSSLLSLPQSHTLKQLSSKEMEKRIQRSKEWRASIGHVDEEEMKQEIQDGMEQELEQHQPIVEEIPQENENVIPDDLIEPFNDSFDMTQIPEPEIEQPVDEIEPPPQRIMDEDEKSLHSLGDQSLLQADQTRDEENAGAARQFFSESTQPEEEDGNETADEAMEQDTKKQTALGTDLSQRTRKMHELLKKEMKKSSTQNTTTLETIVKTAPKLKKRNIAAIVFQQLLVLKTHDFVNVQQDEPYADIIITKTHSFDTAFSRGRGRAVAV